MKNILKYFTILIAALAVVSCDADLTNKNLYEDATFVTELEQETAQKNNIDGVNNFKVSSAVTNPSAVVINDVTYNEVVITFANGRVDNTTTNLANIVFYPLTAPTSPTTITPNTRGTALSPASTKVEYTTDTTKIYYRFATTDTTFTGSDFEVVVAASITAFNGAISLNQDGDKVQGETIDDMFIQTTEALTGIARKTTMTFSLPAANTISLDATTFDFYIDVTSNFSNTLSTTSLAGDLLVEKYNYTTHTWAALSNVTLGYDSDLNDDTTYNDGRITIDMPANLADGDLVRCSLKQGSMSQDASLIASDDYIYTLDINNETESTYTYQFSDVKVSAAYFSGTSLAPTHNNVEGNKYIDVQFNGLTGNILPATLTNNNVKFSKTINGKTVYFTFDEADVFEVSNNTFRFKLTTALDITTMTVTAFPTVMEDNNTPTDTSDDLHFGSSNLILNPLAAFTAPSV